MPENKNHKPNDLAVYLLITSICFIIGGIVMMIGDMHFAGYRPMFAKVGSTGGIYILSWACFFSYVPTFLYHPLAVSGKPLMHF